MVLELREEKTRLASDKNKIIERCGQLKDIHDYVMGFREGTAL